MPNDDTEVMEQTAEEGFDEAFSEGDDEVVVEEEETEVVDDDEEETEEEEQEETTEEEETDEEEVEEETDETDEVEERGKELLDAEKTRQEEEAARAAAKETATAAVPQPVSPGLAKSLASLVSRDILPDEDIEINGEQYNLRAFYDENPEISAIVGVGFREGMNRLLQNGQIMTAQQVNETVQKSVFNAVITSQHRDAVRVVESAEFSEWLDKEATDAEKALFRSTDAVDHVLGLSRFKNRAATKGVREKATKAKEKSVTQKGKHVDLHKHTARSKPPSKKSAAADDFDTVFEENAE